MSEPLPDFVLAVIDYVTNRPPPRQHEPVAGCIEPDCDSPDACTITCEICWCHPPYCGCV